ncbi:MAG: hypothetical protein D6712_11885 [Chloroflexi bacterium]|nr:MAG: hypothetical protein D6712_11885 [Chloroflexota bacterium]
MDFLTPEFFDTLVIAVIIIGGALAVVRLYRDFTRPLMDEHPQWAMDDTQPTATITKDESDNTL